MQCEPERGMWLAEGEGLQGYRVTLNGQQTPKLNGYQEPWGFALCYGKKYLLHPLVEMLSLWCWLPFQRHSCVEGHSGGKQVCLLCMKASPVRFPSLQLS